MVEQSEVSLRGSNLIPEETNIFEGFLALPKVKHFVVHLIVVQVSMAVYQDLLCSLARPQEPEVLPKFNTQYSMLKARNSTWIVQHVLNKEEILMKSVKRKDGGRPLSVSYALPTS